MSLTVLIADDDRDLARIVAYAARQVWPGCRVLIAADGGTALRHFAAEGPDVVILDVEMPPPDGCEVCRRIRATSGAPILMLTARDDPADKARAATLGATAYLTKPFDDRDLLAHLQTLTPAPGGHAP